MKNFKKLLILATLLISNVISMFGMMPNISHVSPHIPVSIAVTPSGFIATPEHKLQKTLPTPTENDTVPEKELISEQQAGADDRNCLHNYSKKQNTKKLKSLDDALQNQDHAKISMIMTESDFDAQDLLSIALNAPVLNYQIIQLLLDNGARLLASDIYHFIKQDNVEFIQFLIDHHFIIYNWDNVYSFGQNRSDFHFIMQKAIAFKSFKIAKLLCNNNLFTNTEKNLALHIALLQDQNNISLDIIQLLLEQEARITNAKTLGCTPPNLLPLLFKYPIDQTIKDEALIDAIYRNEYSAVKFYLESGAAQITKDILAKAINSQCSDDIINLLFAHGATIPFATERELLHHKNSDFVAKMLSIGTSREQNKIKEATDLTIEQKKLLLNVFAQLNLIDIFTNNNYDSIKNIPRLDISEKLLLQYFPLGLWINEQHEQTTQCRQYLSYISNPFDNSLSPTLASYLKELKIKKNQTLTEQLLINLARQRPTLGENAIFSGKDPIDESGMRRRSWSWHSNSNYYQAGFAGDLLQTKIVDQIIQTEKELQAQGFETFFSGRAWEWNFVNDIWQMLEELKTGKNNQDKISLRFRDQNCDIAQLQQYRQDLVANGAEYHIGTGTNKQGKESEVTFMNKTVISNPGYKGECTGTYFVDNRSVARHNTGWKMIEKLFEQKGLTWYFQKHKDEIKALYNQHAKTNNFGELLCIAVKKDHVDTMVYAATSGGFKVPLLNASKHIQYLKSNSLKLKRFLDQNHIFYCFAVSDIPGEYGTKYQIKSLHLADPEKYEAYKKSRDAFAAKMKEDLLSEPAISEFFKKE